MTRWSLLLCPLPLTPALEQSFVVTTADWNQASDSCCDEKQAPLQGLSLLEELLFFFKVNSCSSSGRKGRVHRQPCCQPDHPAGSKAPAAHTTLPVLASTRHRNISRSKGTHTDSFPTYSLTHSLFLTYSVYYSTVLLQPQTDIQFKLPFPTILCFWYPHYILFYGYPFVLVLCFWQKNLLGFPNW